MSCMLFSRIAQILFQLRCPTPAPLLSSPSLSQYCRRVSSSSPPILLNFHERHSKFSTL